MKSIVWFWIFSLLLLATVQVDNLPNTKSQNQSTLTPPKLNNYPNVTLDEQIDEQQLHDVQEEYRNEQTAQLSSWLSKQLNDSRSVPEMAKAESFIIHLQPDQSYEYRWDLNIPGSKKREYYLLLSVYTHLDGTDIALSHDPEQDSFITVETRQDLHDSYSELGKVYVSRSFKMHFLKDAKVLRLTNFYSHPILVQISMEIELKPLQLIKQTIAVDKHFQLSAKKLAAVVEQAKQTDKTRTQVYKWEWGFLQREDRYEDEMLKLTGVELLAILATAIIQMYCIKGLLQRQQIV